MSEGPVSIAASASPTVAPFADRLARGVLVADGAMGTVLHAAGNPLDRALPELNLLQPELVRTIHEGYLDAGAELVQTNTFGATRLRLSLTGLGDRVEDINAAGVRVARVAVAACGRPVYVGGSVSPAVTIRQRRSTSPKERAAAVREQVLALAGAGADLVVLETFGHLDELVEAVRATADVCDLPILAQATFAGDGRMLSGHTPAELCDAAADLPITVLGTNCTLGPQGLHAVVAALRGATDLPLAAQPNAGLPRRTGSARFEYDLDADYFGRYARLLADAGATVVGGCCGTTPVHIRAAAVALRAAAGTSPATTRPRREPSAVGGGRRPLTVGVALEPPAAGGLAATIATARRVRELGAGLFCVAAGRGPRAHLSPVNVVAHLQNELGVEALACVPTWDKTIMALQADLLGAHALGVRRIVCETGSPPLLGDYPHVDGIWDVDSVGLAGLLTGLNAGVDHNGLRLAGRTAFDVGARVNPGAGDLAAELARTRRKIEAGARYLLTRPVYELDRLERLVAALEAPAPPVLVVVRALLGFADAEFLHHEVPDVHVPPSTLAALRRAGPAAAAVGVELAADLLRSVAGVADGVVVALPAGGAGAEPLLAAALEADRRIAGPAPAEPAVPPDGPDEPDRDTPDPRR